MSRERVPVEPPPVSDPYWIRQAERVLSYLEKPRTWPAMKAWAKRQKMNQEILRNTVAWCDLKGFAVGTMSEDRPILWWAVSTWKASLGAMK